MRHLGIDYGTKKIGLALSDEAGTMGFPHTIIPNGPGLLEAVRSLIAAEGVGAVVIGESRDFSGVDNPVASAARAFGDALGAQSRVPVFFEAEMLTTQEARRAIDGAHPRHVGDAARKGKSPDAREAVDASAAALILTSYLSRNHD